MTSVDSEMLRDGRLWLDPEQSRAGCGDHIFNLPVSSFRLLALFVKHAGHPLTRQQIRAGLWGERADIKIRTVDQEVARLRKAIKTNPKVCWIHTVRGRGYVLGMHPDEDRSYQNYLEGRTN